MQEYVSEAVVLSKEPRGELDVRVSLFLRRFGKMTMRAKSARKITSKLSAHLEPGNVVRVRLIEKNGFQVADALKSSRLPLAPTDLHFLDRLLAEDVPDHELWELLTRGAFHWGNVLRMMGWDPAAASCRSCGRKAEVFDMRSHDFLCAACAMVSRGRADELLYIASLHT